MGWRNIFRLGGKRRRAVLPGREEIAKHRRRTAWREVAIRRVVNLHDRRQRAATQARNFLNGERLAGIRVGIAIELEFAANGVLNEIRSFNVTGCAMTHTQEMFTD